MTVATATTPRVYVGTYGKYNRGSLEGKWLDLEDYSSRDEFYEACAELHKNEHDPEYMFQDYEGFPKAFYGESHLSEELWDWLELDEDDRELLAVYADVVGEHYGATIDQARDAFQGRYKDEEDYAYDFLESTGALHSMPEDLRCYFDYEGYARDLRLNGDVTYVDYEGETWVFSNH